MNHSNKFLVLPPSVVCMTSANSLILSTLNMNLCSHLIIVENSSLINDIENYFQLKSLTSDIRMFSLEIYRFSMIINFKFS